MSIFEELKRRNVLRVGIAYVVVAWLALQVADVILNNVGSPDWVFWVILLLLGIGLPFAVIFAWAFELTPEGLKREHEVDRSQTIPHHTGRKLDFTIIGALVLALGYFAYDKFVLSPERDAELVEATTQAVAEQPATEPEVSAESDKSIAVLPFVNMSDDASNEYFSDGISEELLNLLTRIPELRVIARTSSFAFKGKDVSITEIAEALNVTHVLEGSVRKSGDRVRITTQLIRANDSSHLWSQSYDRTLEDIFAVQDEIAAAVVAQLKVKLLGEVPKVQATDPQAYALLLQARHVGNQGTPEAWVQSIGLTKEALAIDSESSVAWGSLALNFAIQVPLNLQLVEAPAVQARDAARRALAIDPDSAAAEVALGMVARYANWNLEAAARHYERALALNPTNAGVLMVAGELAGILGRVDDAIEIQEFVVSRDPLYPWGHFWLGRTYFEARRLDEGIASLRNTLRLSPQFFAAEALIGLALLQKGEPEAALKSIKQESVEQYRLGGLVYVYHALGNAAESDAARDELMEKYGQQNPAGIALVLAYRGENDRAFEWLEKAVQYQDPELMRITSEAKFWGNPFQNDPRWLPFLESIGLAPAQLAAIKFNVKLPE